MTGQMFVDAGMSVEDVIIHHGEERQIDKAIEEMSELTKALAKHRYKEVSYTEVAEEIADVCVMIPQLLCLYNAHDDVDRIVGSKIRRLKMKMESEGYVFREAE